MFAGFKRLFTKRQQPPFGLPLEDSKITAPVLNKAFQTMAMYLIKKRVNITIIVIGGALSTYHLQTRESTSDVDFFLDRPKHPAARIVYKAARKAEQQHKDVLLAGWLNDAVQLFLSQVAGLQRMVWDEAVEQNEIVFIKTNPHGGLTVLAAPWRYSIVAKLQRMGIGNPLERDIAHAISFLRHYLGLNGRSTIAASELTAWADHYSSPFAGHSLDIVNNAAPGLVITD